jgi:uncharacterized protein involved in cysteine biosynthesis
VIDPLLRALAQWHDPVFLGVLLRSLFWSAACFIALHFVAIWAIQGLLDLHGWLGWAASIAGSLAASLLALWLFLPVAVIIGTLYLNRIAEAVERRYYPGLPPARGSRVADDIMLAIGIAARVVLFNLLALVAALFLPGIGLILGWVIAGYAIGRGLFLAVAMRRLPPTVAELLYRRSRTEVLILGCILALAGYVPLLNLLIPVIGIATMVHVYSQVARMQPG